MSTGFVCECSGPIHPPRPEGRTGCSRYAADQELGGLCASCASGWHYPCGRARLSPGVCNVCGWHGSEHEADR